MKTVPHTPIAFVIYLLCICRCTSVWRTRIKEQLAIRILKRKRKPSQIFKRFDLEAESPQYDFLCQKQRCIHCARFSNCISYAAISLNFHVNLFARSRSYWNVWAYRNAFVCCNSMVHFPMCIPWMSNTLDLFVF